MSAPLPPLPEPVMRATLPLYDGRDQFYTADQMTAYALLSRADLIKRCPMPKPYEDWISVADKLPGFLDSTLTTDGKSVKGAYRTGEYPNGKVMWSAWGDRDTVTHWVPYPRPPVIDAAKAGIQ